MSKTKGNTFSVHHSWKKVAQMEQKNIKLIKEYKIMGYAYFDRTGPFNHQRFLCAKEN